MSVPLQPCLIAVQQARVDCADGIDRLSGVVDEHEEAPELICLRPDLGPRADHAGSREAIA